jgi:hypothetical protein
MTGTLRKDHCVVASLPRKPSTQMLHYMILTACFCDLTRPPSTRLLDCLRELLIADLRQTLSATWWLQCCTNPAAARTGVGHSVTAITVACFAHHNIGILPTQASSLLKRCIVSL